MEALVDLGVERERLFVTYSGLGAATAVHFLPRSQRPYAPTTASEYLAEDTFAVVHEGITRASGNEVLCNLPAKAALYVDETYYLQVAPPPLEDQPSLTLDNKRILPVGKAHFRAAYQQFTIKADSDPDIVKDVRLELKRVKRGALKVTARRKEEGQWWDKLHTLPGKIPYAVHKVIRRRRAKGEVTEDDKEIDEKADKAKKGEVIPSEERKRLEAESKEADEEEDRRVAETLTGQQQQQSPGGSFYLTKKREIDLSKVDTERSSSPSAAPAAERDASTASSRASSDKEEEEERRNKALRVYEFVESTPILQGFLHTTRPGCLGDHFEPDMLEPGCRYEVRVQATGATRFASEQFIEIAEAQEIELGVGPCGVHGACQVGMGAEYLV